MNGEHSGPGEQGNNTEVDPAEQARLDAEARARQDPANHPRMQAMDAIATRLDTQIEDQLAAEGLDPRNPERVVDNRTQGAVEDTQRTQQQEDVQQTRQQPQQPAARQPAARAPSPDQLLKQFGDEPVAMEALDNLKVKVKIDGVERTMSLQELRRTAQLDGAAMARLEQANTLLKKAQEAAAGGATPPVGVEGKPGSGDSPATSKDVTAAAESLVDALFVGDKAAAVETVTKLLAGAQPAATGFDRASIAKELIPAVRQQLSEEEAEAQFRTDFKDVLADPVLVLAADRFYDEEKAIDPQKSHAELLATAGTRTREWVQARAGSVPGGEPRTTRQKKLEAKQGLDEPRALNRTEQVEEEVVQTPSQVIEEMKKARGLA